MSDIGKLMRSAANELNKYILAENERMAATVHSQMESPPDYHDQQTCYELQIEARTVDKMQSRIVELEKALFATCTETMAVAGHPDYSFDSQISSMYEVALEAVKKLKS